MVVSIIGLVVKLLVAKKKVIILDYGTDFLKTWTLTEDGDIRLITGENNLSQGLVNRLSCDLNSLDLFYNDYGSLLVQFLGWKRNDTTLNFIKLELENRLRNEARLESFNVKVDYADSSNGIVVSIDLNPSEDYVHTVELRINEDGVETIE